MEDVRNPEGIWINSRLFREVGDFWMKNGYYTAEPEDSPAYIDFWSRERDRCINGYSIGGAKITGSHYFYLNYCPIDKVEVIGSGRRRAAKKTTGLPDFWEGDYNYFWIRDIARLGILEAMGCSPSYIDSVYNIEDDKERNKILMEHYDKLGLMYQPIPENLDGGLDLIVGKSRRKGFEQPHSELVMTPDGYTTMGEVKIGDTILTPKGIAKVMDKFPQGKKDVYEVTLYDGRKVKCGENHLWKVYSHLLRKNYRTTKVLKTSDLIKSGLTKKKGVAYKWLLPINEPIEYSEKDLPIDPYVLGALLGDGGITKNLRISSTDVEIIDKIILNLTAAYPWVNGTWSAHRHDNYWTISLKNITKEEVDKLKRIYGTSKFAKSVNPVFEELKKLGLNCITDNKFIPDIYKFSSKEQRLELLRGLMDTDGYCSKKGDISFTNKSEKFVSDVQDICYSLGIQATKRLRKDGLWILYISTSENIFSLKRKSERINPDKDRLHKFIPIVKIEKLDYQEESSCILIDDEEHLYLTRGYVVTHNSYKNAACACNNFFHRPKSRTLVMGYEKKYLYPGIDTFFGKCQSYINHINDNTGWKQPTDYINKQNHIRASYKQKNADGLEVEKGILSEIFAISFKDNPDAGRGSDTYDIFGEEVGAWGVPGGLKDTISAMRSSTEAGAFKTGMITLFGTSGDLDKGTVDFAEMFESPQAFNFMAFYDIWGKYHDKVEGFFFPRQLNCEGYMDDNGNSDIQGATDYELKIREQKKKGGATSVQLQKKMYEDPLNSAEAFGIVAHNAFPVVELKAQLDKVIAMKWQESKGTPVRFSREDGKVVAKPVMDGSAEPITTYILKSNNLEGCPVIYEFPGENPPRGLYKIGYDPIRQDTGTSLAAIIVYKSAGIGEFYHDNIVAEYIGRYEDPEDIDRVAEDMADYFNTTIMYENECTGTKNYFRKIRRLNLLALQPDAVISKNLKGSKVSRVYGCHMVEGLKDAGERYIKSWLMSIIDYDENDTPITVIDRIYSRRLLEELINYNRKGNFDLVSALIMCMFQVQNDSMTDNFTEEKEPQAKILLNMIGNMYIKN